MRKITVPIMTEEYKVVVFLGNRDEIEKAAMKYLDCGEEKVQGNFRGRAFNCMGDGLHPLIIIDTSFDVITGFSTLAHEASHAMDFIQSFLGMHDTSGEFHAHGIASVMRHTLKDLQTLIEKNKK